jgi:hypothetical protein
LAWHAKSSLQIFFRLCIHVTRNCGQRHNLALKLSPEQVSVQTKAYALIAGK